MYALGVVLCELLTGSGRRPPAKPSPTTAAACPAFGTAVPRCRRWTQANRRAGARQIAAAHVRAARRTRLGGGQGDAPRPQIQRYASAAALADDLCASSTAARCRRLPPSRGYAVRKFAAAPSQAGIAAASLVALALVGGLALSVYGLCRRARSAAIAEPAQRELEKVAAFQQSMLEGIDIEAMGIGMATGLREQVAQQAAADPPGFELGLAHASTADIARGLVDRDILANAERAIDRDFAREPALAADLRESVAKVRLALACRRTRRASSPGRRLPRRRAGRGGARNAARARQQQAAAMLERPDKDALALVKPPCAMPRACRWANRCG